MSSGPPLRIREADGTPSRVYATELVFPNGTLTQSGGRMTYTPASVGGTVTSVSGVNANGFTWFISNPTTTPALTLTQQNAAADGSTKGQAGFVAADFNASSGIISLDYTNAQKATGSVPGFLSATDWTTFNAKVSGSGTTDTLAKFTASGAIGDSPISVSGADVVVQSIGSTSLGDVSLSANQTQLVVNDVSRMISLSATGGATVSITGTLAVGGGGALVNTGAGGTLGTNAFTSTAYAPLASPALTGTPSAPSLSLSGTGGLGFLQIANQSSAPLTPTSASRIFFDNSNRFSWKGTNGFVRTFDGTANTQDRVYTLPDAASTFPVFSQTVTFTGPTVARTVTLPDASFTVARTDAANTFTGTQTITTLAGIATITGTTGNMTITSGTGNSRTIALQTTTSGGTATTALTLNADQSATFTAGATFGNGVSDPAIYIRKSSGGGGTYKMALTVTGPLLASDAVLAITNGDVFGTIDTTISRASPGTVQIGTTSANALGSLTLTGITMGTAGKLAISSGTNQRAGNATLVGGTVTVSNTTVTANTLVMLTRKTSGGTIGTAITYTVSAGTSFTITSDNVLDTSTFSFLLIENP